MDDEQQLWTLEEQFWTGDAPFYRRHLAADCVMLFPPPVGMLSGEQIIESLANAPRWTRVTLGDRRVLQLADEALLLLYEADGKREGQPSPYRALVASGYVLRNGAWMLAFHQQTPGSY